MTKTCSVCETSIEHKRSDAKYCSPACRRSEYHTKYYQDNKDAYAERGKVRRESDRDGYRKYHREYHHNNKDKKRDAQLKYEYGVSLVEYNTMFEQQGMCCAACKSDVNQGLIGKNFPLDHCHSTGKVRGVLCTNCNKALGLLADNPERVLNLYKYLLDNG